jgi:hypothetical protein
VVLDQRPEAPNLVAVRLAPDHRVRVADGYGRQLDLFARDLDRLRLSDLDLAHVELDLAAAEPSGDLARPDPDAHPLLPAPPCEPARRDPRSVPGELGRRAVRVPDHDLGLGAVRGDDFEDPVRADAEVVVADAPDPLRRQRNVQLRPFHEQVIVPETVPFRESHPRGRPAGAGHPG